MTSSELTIVNAALVAEITELRRRVHEVADLRDSNRKLTEANERLTEANRELKAANADLKSTQLTRVREAESLSLAAASDRQKLLVEADERHAQLEALKAQLGTVRAEHASLIEQYRASRERLQRVYDLKWTRLGAKLRKLVRPLRRR